MSRIPRQRRKRKQMQKLMMLQMTVLMLMRWMIRCVPRPHAIH